MEQYILKSDLVAEIERRITNIKGYCLREGHDTRFDVVPEQLSLILAFINTLEVKENDLDYIDGSWGFEETWTFGQYCYTLGLKAQKGE